MQTGYIRARVYTSDAQIPIENAVFSVYKEDGNKTILLGTRTTDSEGVTTVVPVEAPDSILSQNQGNDNPFAVVSIRIDHPEYRTVYVNGVQVFAGQISVQETAMQPVDRNVSTDSRAQRFDVSKQNL